MKPAGDYTQTAKGAAQCSPKFSVAQPFIGVDAESKLGYRSPNSG